MPKNPTLLVFHPLEEEIPEGIWGALAGKAIIQFLIILLRFEPEFIRVRKEHQAEEQEEDDKSEGGLGHIVYDVIASDCRERSNLT